MTKNLDYIHVDVFEILRFALNDNLKREGEIIKRVDEIKKRQHVLF